jgi:hypothetical protein
MEHSPSFTKVATKRYNFITLFFNLKPLRSVHELLINNNSIFLTLLIEDAEWRGGNQSDHQKESRQIAESSS